MLWDFKSENVFIFLFDYVLRVQTWRRIQAPSRVSFLALLDIIECINEIIMLDLNVIKT